MGNLHRETLVLRRHPTMPLLVDRDGRLVFERRDGAWLSHTPRPRGSYMMVSTRTCGSRRVHVLVLEAFMGLRPGLKCRHLNGDPLDNRLANLRWGTQAENCADTVRHGRSTRGERNGSAVLTEAAVHDILLKRTAGVSLRELADEHDVAIGTICDISARRTWRHVAFSAVDRLHRVGIKAARAAKEPR